MKLDEIIELSKEKGDGMRFTADPGQNIKEEIVFEVLDAHFGFITYTGSQGGFVTVDTLKKHGMAGIEFTIK